MKKPAPSTPPNMSKEYRKELRGLDKSLRAIARQQRAIQATTDKSITRILRDSDRQIRGLDKAGVHIERRKAILMGRLS